MKSYRNQLIILSKRLLLLVVIYQLCRLAFLLANFNYFQSSEFSDVVLAFISGLRFDLNAIILLNLPLILIHLLPVNWFYSKITQTTFKLFFLLINIPSILLNCIDLEYFKYQGKRTTADLFQLFGMGDDMKNTIPQMAMDFWYVLLVFAILTTFMIFVYNRIRVEKPSVINENKTLNWLMVIPLLAVFFVGGRGGFQYKPLGIMAAARNTNPQLVPLVLNTPFTVLKTYGKKIIEEKNYMPEDEAKSYFNKDHLFKRKSNFKPLNVIVIILESFSSEYIGALNNGRGYTPFLDSLMHESLTFSNAFANAKKSIDGIPAVLASMPTLMTASYVSSPYNSNKLKSIAGILKSKGYSSAFFHGGNNGTMNFDNFTLLTGFDKYYGRKEYPQNDYDGHWGVFDENFYYFFSDKCSGMKQPFVCSFFSLSSHHPYNLPDKYRGKFKKGTLPIHESIGYADYSLKCFFEKAKQTDWYKNTLFVITADHTGPSEQAYYNTKAGMFRVPVIFYQPGSNKKLWSDDVTQQTDILPGILDYLNYDEPFSAFGNSMFDTTRTPFAVNFAGDVYQVMSNELVIQFDGTEVAGCYNYRTDSLLMNDIASPKNISQVRLTKTLQSVLQQYNHAMIWNELVPASSKK
ncbi:MAG TPA: LTA synthase family protein [Bacteroidia bacterium]|nr:LTA synthase family protein [Bacteroidia bacterium]